MKYIKLFENYYSDSEWDSKYGEYINWDLINDAEDLALEYIDKGFTLRYHISTGDVNISNGYSDDKIFTGLFNHYQNKTIKKDIQNSEVDDIRYYFYFTGGTTFVYATECKNELVSRLSKIHPNYKINI